MNDTLMTIVGNVVDDPKLRRTKNGHLVASFRVASTSRRWDRESGQWADNSTLFVQVTAWRNLADNVGTSVFKGQPVTVYGRYCQRDYRVEEQVRTAYELDAISGIGPSLGPDLTRGTSVFTRVSRPAGPSVENDEAGIPADTTDEWLGVAGTETTANGDQVDLTTGEVRELVGA